MSRLLLTGNAAAAWGARLAAVDYIPAFPITPQTEIIETIAGWIGSGAMNGRLTMMESEHSMMTAAAAAATTGVRVFTATSSQGLLYAMEMLFTAPGLAAPFVLVNVSRGVQAPVTLQPGGTIRFRARQPLAIGAIVLANAAYSSVRYQIHRAAGAALAVYDVGPTLARGQPAAVAARPPGGDGGGPEPLHGEGGNPPCGGTPMCAGCGGLQARHQVLDVLGEATVAVNAAGCMTLLVTNPYTPLRCSWLYTAMASSPAGAQGVRDALDLLLARGMPADENLTVLVVSGDGAAYGMGLSATSAAVERGHDFIYLVYDNEGYGNTGQQESAVTPHAARTATSGSYRGWKKDLFAIWTAHRPAYAATVIGSEPLDLARKVAKAMALRGPRLLLALAPCPTGWDVDPSETVAIGRLAVATGIWPLKEYENGRVTHTRRLRERLPVAEYLSRQGRFRHLFTPERTAPELAEIQGAVDAYWAADGTI